MINDKTSFNKMLHKTGYKYLVIFEWKLFISNFLKTVYKKYILADVGINNNTYNKNMLYENYLKIINNTSSVQILTMNEYWCNKKFNFIIVFNLKCLN